MNPMIREVQETDIDDVVEFSIRAWEPVFFSFKYMLGEEIFEVLRPNWREEQSRLVRHACQNRQRYVTFVADMGGKAVGFVAVTLNQETLTGEIHLLAVDPNFQSHNIGTQLNLFALDFMTQQGMTFAEVATGGDPGHAPARRAYEKAGFTPMPLVRYYKMLKAS